MIIFPILIFIIMVLFLFSSLKNRKEPRSLQYKRMVPYFLAILVIVLLCSVAAFLVGLERGEKPSFKGVA